jgi:hypothetical protein
VDELVELVGLSSCDYNKLFTTSAIVLRNGRKAILEPTQPRHPEHPRAAYT